MEIEFFTGPEEFRGWLENYHNKATELWIGFIKKAKWPVTSLGYPEAVEVALCYGWIDGKVQSIDQSTYKVRFTPRKPASGWSLINIKRVEKLTDAGLMQSAGLAAFGRRKPEKSGIYSFEQEAGALPPEIETGLKENPPAWLFFSGSSFSYKKNCIHWIMNAKQETTRTKRLNILIESSAAGLKIPLLRSNPGQLKSG